MYRSILVSPSGEAWGLNKHSRSEIGQGAAVGAVDEGSNLLSDTEQVCMFHTMLSRLLCGWMFGAKQQNLECKRVGKFVT